MLRLPTARRRRRRVVSLLFAVTLALAGCVGSTHNQRGAGHRGLLFRSGAAPITAGGVILPRGPLGLLIRHVPAGSSRLVAVDLKSARQLLGLAPDALPSATAGADARQLLALTGLAAPRGVIAPAWLGRLRAAVAFSGTGGSGVLLRLTGGRRVTAAALRRSGWRGGGGVFGRADGAAAVLFRGGLAFSAQPRTAAAAAAQDAVPASVRRLSALLGTVPAPAASATLPGAGSCLASVVAIEQLAPHDAAVTVTVRGAARPGRVELGSGAAVMRAARLRAGQPTVRGGVITVPIVPRAGSPVAGGAILGALAQAPLYRCG